MAVISCGAGDTEMFKAGLSRRKAGRLIIEIIWFLIVLKREVNSSELLCSFIHAFREHCDMQICSLLLHSTFNCLFIACLLFKLFKIN